MRAWLLAVAAAGAAAVLAPPEPLGPTRPVRLDAWRIVGPGGGGTTRRPAVSPHDPKVVVIACDMSGAYITTDGGASWRMFNLGSVPTAFAFDPKSPATLYAGAEGLYKSEDGGGAGSRGRQEPGPHARNSPRRSRICSAIATDCRASRRSGEGRCAEPSASRNAAVSR